uniref:hypothetical protein n=1 Tax=Singerocybe alboinfundibuliformis TaxID=1346812 RepID=UPI0030FEBCBF
MDQNFNLIEKQYNAKITITHIFKYVSISIPKGTTLTEQIREDINKYTQEIKNQSFSAVSLEEQTQIVDELDKFRYTINLLNERHEYVERMHKFIEFSIINNIFDSKWNAFKNKFSDLNIKTNITEISLEDTKQISQIIDENQTQIGYILILKDREEKGILGDCGEKSVNPVIEESIGIFKNNPKFSLEKYHVSGALGLTSMCLIYKGVVKTYEYNVFKNVPYFASEKHRIEYLRMKSKAVKNFMILGAPIITAAIFYGKNVALPLNIHDSLDINISEQPITNLKPNTELNQVNVLTSGLGFFSIIKNKIPKWLSTTIKIVISILFLNYLMDYVGANSTLNVINTPNFKLIIFMLGVCSSLFLIISNILNLYLFYMFSKDKIKISEYLPQFILDWLNQIKNISKAEEKGIFIQFYLTNILVYLFILILCIFMLNT